MDYVDGFVICVPEKNMQAYKEMAKLACEIWISHGAIGYRECVAEDTRSEHGITFPKLADAKDGETVVFAYITYKSRAHRDEVNSKVMADKRMQEMIKREDFANVFDCAKMAYGGFETIVSA